MNPPATATFAEELKRRALAYVPGGDRSAEGVAASVVNLLLVDDEARNLEVLESILAAPDRNLVRAQSAEEALLALIQRDFAAIVLDIQMPTMSGFDLARLIKQRKRNQHIPIIFLTAYFQDSKDVLSGYDVGAVDYLTKPLDPQILKSKVSVFVELFRSNRALAAANFSLENEIIERRQAELARDRLAAIVESSSDAILSKTLEGVITTWNRGAQRMFGYAAEEIVGSSLAVLLPAGKEDEFWPLRDRVQRQETIETFETVRVCKDGRLLDVSVTLSALRDEQGNINGVSSILRDISERKRLEAEILQVSEREQRRISADLHDGVGQQLGGISCLSDVLKKNLAEQGSPEAEAADKICRLLNVAMAQTRSLARGLHPVEAEANGLMAALEDLAERVADVFKVSCQFECPQPVLIGDGTVATHLYRIVQEAVTNAIKHGQAGRIRITLETDAARHVVSVSDNGTGFNPRATVGKGLGLRIMNHRAGVIKATLAIEPNPEGGTRVICAVPQGPPATAED